MLAIKSKTVLRTFVQLFLETALRTRGRTISVRFLHSILWGNGPFTNVLMCARVEEECILLSSRQSYQFFRYPCFHLPTPSPPPLGPRHGRRASSAKGSHLLRSPLPHGARAPPRPQPPSRTIPQTRSHCRRILHPPFACGKPNPQRGRLCIRFTQSDLPYPSMERTNSSCSSSRQAHVLHVGRAVLGSSKAK